MQAFVGAVIAGGGGGSPDREPASPASGAPSVAAGEQPAWKQPSRAAREHGQRPYSRPSRAASPTRPAGPLSTVGGISPTLASDQAAVAGGDGSGERQPTPPSRAASPTRLAAATRTSPAALQHGQRRRRGRGRYRATAVERRYSVNGRGRLRQRRERRQLPSSLAAAATYGKRQLELRRRARCQGDPGRLLRLGRRNVPTSASPGAEHLHRPRLRWDLARDDFQPRDHRGHFIDTSTGAYRAPARGRTAPMRRTSTTSGPWTSAPCSSGWRACRSRAGATRRRSPRSATSARWRRTSTRRSGSALDNKHITTIDEGGVALAAIQGLYRQNQALQRENRTIQRENRTLRAQLGAQNTRLTKLEQAFSKLSR